MIRSVEHRGRSWQMVDENKHTAWILGEELPVWEVDTFDTIDEFVKGGVYVDVGAWIGMFVLYAAPLASHVYALEPDPVARDMLHRNLALNDIRNVTVIGSALWSHDGTVELHSHEMLGDSMTGPSRHGVPFTFPAMSTDTLRQLAGTPDLVKVDTEGSESYILPGIIDWPVPIHLSVHVPELHAELDFGERTVTPLSPRGPYHTVLVQ